MDAERRLPPAWESSRGARTSGQTRNVPDAPDEIAAARWIHRTGLRCASLREVAAWLAMPGIPFRDRRSWCKEAGPEWCAEQAQAGRCVKRRQEKPA